MITRLEAGIIIYFIFFVFFIYVFIKGSINLRPQILKDKIEYFAVIIISIMFALFWPFVFMCAIAWKISVKLMYYYINYKE